jgi:hypothetical protein
MRSIEEFDLSTLETDRLPSSENAAAYPNLSRFIRGVDLVNDPSLTDGERLVLKSLAAVADYRTATSHPGNHRLMVASNRSQTGVNFCLRGLMSKGLIERISVGNGSGLASVYRICVEDSRFPGPKLAPKADAKHSIPDCYVSQTNDGKNRSSSDCYVSADNPSSEWQRNVAVGPENVAVWTATHPNSLPRFDTPPSPPAARQTGGPETKSQTAKPNRKTQTTAELRAQLKAAYASKNWDAVGKIRNILDKRPEYVAMVTRRNQLKRERYRRNQTAR